MLKGYCHRDPCFLVMHINLHYIMIEISAHFFIDLIDIKMKTMYLQHWSKPPQPVLEDPEDAKKKKGGAAKPDPKKKK